MKRRATLRESSGAQMSRRRFLRVSGLGLAGAAFGGTLLGGCGAGSSAENFPEQPVELIVPYGAGGATDSQARAFARAAEPVLGQTITVVNRPGGGGAIAATEAASADPDGYTMFLATGGVMASTPELQDVAYSIDDFVGIAGLADQPYVFASSADSQWQTLNDLGNADERIEYTITGVGNNTHVAAASFFQEAGVTAEAVPVDAATSALQEVIGGRTDAAAIDMNIGMPQVEAGEARPLAVTSSERLDYLPDVPTFEEEGYGEASNILSRVGLVVPTGTPGEVVSTLRQAASEARESQEFQDFIDNNYLLPTEAPDGERWLNELMRSEREKARRDLERLNIEGGE